eukprot:jgi/Botrbrau1/3926/Bobra.0365s0002.1
METENVNNFPSYGNSSSLQNNCTGAAPMERQQPRVRGQRSRNNGSRPPAIGSDTNRDLHRRSRASRGRPVGSPLNVHFEMRPAPPADTTQVRDGRYQQVTVRDTSIHQYTQEQPVNRVGERTQAPRVGPPRPRGRSTIRHFNLRGDAFPSGLDPASLQPTQSAVPSEPSELRTSGGASFRRTQGGPPHIRGRSRQAGEYFSATEGMLAEQRVPAVQQDYCGTTSILPETTAQPNRQYNIPQRAKASARDSQNKQARKVNHVAKAGSRRDKVEPSEAHSPGVPATSGNMQEDEHICVVCSCPTMVVMSGKCNHAEVCAMCAVRLRHLYGDLNCPLCKQNLDQVILTPWVPSMPKFESISDSTPMPCFPKSAGIRVDDKTPLHLPSEDCCEQPMEVLGCITDQEVFKGHAGRMTSTLSVPGLRPSARERGTALKLSQIIEANVRPFCWICRRGPFDSFRRLESHMKSHHNRYVCSLCHQGGHFFPRELHVYDYQGFQKHVDSHPTCYICQKHEFDRESLRRHADEDHFLCNHCPLSAMSYYSNAHDLLQHLGDSHFLCPEPSCRSCFVAFRLPTDLAAHMEDYHRRALPQDRNARARVLNLGPDAFPVRGAARGNRSRHAQAEPVRQEGGLVLVDDDLGFMASYPPLPSSGQAATRQPPATQPAARAAEDFPPLSASTSAPAPPQRARPRLVKVVVHCPCRRRIAHPVVEDGETPPALRCDAECERQRRNAQLAEAFEIDPDRYIPFTDRNRSPDYCLDLLIYAWHHREFTDQVERQFAAFVASNDRRRRLPAMPREERKFVQQLASEYRIAATSQGQQPNRAVELFKTNTASIPGVLLSRAAARMTLADLEKRTRLERGYELYLTDVSESADLDHIFQVWANDYTVERGERPGDYVLGFKSALILRDVMNRVGGGYPGLFKVNSSATLRGLKDVSLAAPFTRRSGLAAAPPASRAVDSVVSQLNNLEKGTRRPLAGPSSSQSNPGQSRSSLTGGATKSATPSAVNSQARAQRPALETLPVASSAYGRTKSNEVRDAPSGSRYAAGGPSQTDRTLPGSQSAIVESWEDAAGGM